MALKLSMAPSLLSRTSFLSPRSSNAQTPQSSMPLTPSDSRQTLSQPLGGLFGTRGRNSLTPLMQEVPISQLDPDEMFSRFTVAEVKHIAAKLSADADAKQEELRLMVGERYRDLLQASESIIDMSASSVTVAKTLEKIHDTCTRSPAMRLHQVQSPSRPEDDTQLQTLQSFSAHLKLLLDCPEHIWRLLERKSFLQATWLMLLARMVHSSLVGDAEETSFWRQQGIEVLEQFPLVQKQWEIINSFRAQINHKATASLRDSASVAEDIMHSLISVLLLDSLSLQDSLSLFLNQRAKAVQALIARNTLPQNQISTSSGTTLAAPVLPTSRARRRVVKDVKECLSSSIQLVVDTVAACREIYGRKSDQNQSRIEQYLIDMQQDNSTSGGPRTLSSNIIISSLPSAPILALYLPDQIKNYIPYFDTEGLLLLSQPLEDKLESWFKNGLKVLHRSVDGWMQSLESSREVDEVRSSILEGAMLDSISAEERELLKSLLNRACQQRINSLWKQKLQNMVDDFKEKLEAALEVLKDDDPGSNTDLNPGNFALSSSLPYPQRHRSTLSLPGLMTSLDKFTSTIQLRLQCRTPLLNTVLTSLEELVKSLQEERETIGSHSGDLKTPLINVYQPVADQTCQQIANILADKLQSCQSTTGHALFIGRLAYALASNLSSFMANIGASPSNITQFKMTLEKLHGQSINQWRGVTARNFGMELVSSWFINKVAGAPLPVSTSPSRPSHKLLSVLFDLITASKSVGVPVNEATKHSDIQDIMAEFIRTTLVLLDEKGAVPSSGVLQILYDLEFLQLLSRKIDLEADPLQLTISKLKIQVLTILDSKQAKILIADIENSISVVLPRMQILLGALLECGVHISSKSVPQSLLPYGQPLVDQEFTPAIVLAKPSARFTMLPIAGTTGR